MTNKIISGNPNLCTYALVGEAPSFMECIGEYQPDGSRIPKPFIGPAGSILNSQLTLAGIDREYDCYVTNTFHCRVNKDKRSSKLSTEDGQLLYSPGTKAKFTDLGRSMAEELYREVVDTNASIIIALGDVAWNALMPNSGLSITQARGSVYWSEALGKKILPTFHPSSVLQGSYLNKYFLAFDLRKARRHAQSPTDMLLPKYSPIWPHDFEQLISRLRALKSYTKPMAIDIEVQNRQACLIGFGLSPTAGLVVQTTIGWSPRQEAEIWSAIADILEGPAPKLLQNGPFDRVFMLTEHQIYIAPPIYDTMVEFSLVYPDFPKGLDTLTSIYTDQPYYKDMYKYKDDEIAKEEG